jgi:hypothetical protein
VTLRKAQKKLIKKKSSMLEVRASRSSSFSPARRAAARVLIGAAFDLGGFGVEPLDLLREHEGLGSGRRGSVDGISTPFHRRLVCFYSNRLKNRCHTREILTGSNSMTRWARCSTQVPKPCHASASDITQSSCKPSGAAVKPLLELNTVAGILYSKFRNNAVHGVKVEIDDLAFFSERAPYWQPLYSELYPPFYFIKFPARFLIQLVQNCLKTLRQKFLATEKLPPDIHWLAFGYDIEARTDLLDTELLGEGRMVRLQNK